jgi:hypothetical protein
MKKRDRKTSITSTIMALKGKEIIINAEPIKVLHMLCLEYHSVTFLLR